MDHTNNHQSNDHPGAQDKPKDSEGANLGALADLNEQANFVGNMQMNGLDASDTFRESSYMNVINGATDAE